MLKAMVAGGQQQLLEPHHHHHQYTNNDTMYYDYYQPQQEYQHYPGQGSPELCPAHTTQLCTLHGDYGPVTVPMVSTNSSPPIAMPVQVPHGHVVQQIVDESGTLRHVILSPQHPPMVPMPTHFGPGPAGGSNQPPQPFFTPQGLPPGYPPFGHGTPLQPGMLGHVPPSQQGHSPPPSHNFHKDERTQRQYIKLKKKLEQKQMRTELMSQPTPPVSPRKELVNGLRGRKGMSSVGTSEDGEESSSVQDEDDDATLIADLLSNIKAPQVAELSSRSALLQWWPPDHKSSTELEISESGLSYEVLLSDKGKEGKYKSIYSGAALSCRIQDLRPGTEYCVCVTAWLEGVAGNASEPTLIRTPPCEPDPPAMPKLITRTRTALQLRWVATTDNGAAITHYVLECEQPTGTWAEMYRGKGKQSNLSKLQPATCYKFRLCAINECGKSEYSEEVVYCTSDSPPAQPAAPVLCETGINVLHLGWEKRPTDDEFTLQMDDRESGHGYLAIYFGKDNSYICNGLRRYSFYKFRLRAHNEEGASQWSEEVTYRTLPSRPAPPCRLSVGGRVHSHAFKAKWDPPSDRGGVDISSYTLQLKKNGVAEFTTVYTGKETECVLDHLNPGTTYEVRVGCEALGGRSEFTEPLVVTTEAVCPGRCAPPRLHGKSRPYSVAVKWQYPEIDGGSPVTECELLVRGGVGQNEDDLGGERTAYRGKDTECTVNALTPGRKYVFLVRASNRVGAGPWSDPLEVRSGSAPPEPPAALQVTPRVGHSVGCTWTEPINNGAPITEYRLELAHGNSQEFVTAYQGPNTSYDIKSVPPASLCHFRLQAYNNTGWSEYSPVATIVSPPGVPGVVSSPRVTATPTSFSISWSPPPDHGDPVTHYCVEVGERSLTTDQTSCDVEGLSPHTTYKIRVRAVNSVGAGPFSQSMRTNTLHLPPPPPVLTCPNVGHNYLKLKWGDGKNPQFTQYTLHMENPRTPESHPHLVYQGTNHSCKVNRLQEQTTYRFSIAAANDSGQGLPSPLYEFSTAIAPPPPLKAPRAYDVSNRTCTVEWLSSKPMGTDPVIYSLQLSRLRDQEYKQVYRGPETKTHLSDLEPGAEYSVRVCPIRHTSSGDLPGAVSPATTFSTIPFAEQATPTHTAKTHNTHTAAHKPLTDQQLSVILVGIFGLVAILTAAIMQHFIY